MGGKCTIKYEKTFKKTAKGARNIRKHEQKPGKKMGQMIVFEDSYCMDGNDRYTPLKWNSRLKYMFVLLGCIILFCYFPLFMGSISFNLKSLLIIFIVGLLSKLTIMLFIYTTAFKHVSI